MGATESMARVRYSVGLSGSMECGGAVGRRGCFASARGAGDVRRCVRIVFIFCIRTSVGVLYMANGKLLRLNRIERWTPFKKYGTYPLCNTQLAILHQQLRDLIHNRLIPLSQVASWW